MLFIGVCCLLGSQSSRGISVPTSVEDPGFNQALQVILPIQVLLSRAESHLFEDYLTRYSGTAGGKVKTVRFFGPPSHCRFNNDELSLGPGDIKELASISVHLERDTPNEKYLQIRHSVCGLEGYLTESIHIYGTNLPPTPWESLLTSGGFPSVDLEAGEFLKIVKWELSGFLRPVSVFRSEFRKNLGGETRSLVSIRDSLVLRQLRAVKSQSSEIRFFSPTLSTIDLTPSTVAVQSPSRICSDATVYFGWGNDDGLKIRIDNVDYPNGLSYPKFDESCFELETRAYGNLLRGYLGQYLPFLIPQVPPEEVSQGPSRNKQLLEEIEELKENIEVGLTQEALEYLEILLEEIEDESILDQR